MYRSFLETPSFDAEVTNLVPQEVEKRRSAVDKLRPLFGV